LSVFTQQKISILAFQAAAVRVAEEKENNPNENRKNQFLKGVNINTLDKADIMTIHRIGPADC